MYRMRPLFDLENGVNIQSNMYSLKNLHFNNLEQSNCLKSNDDSLFEEIEERQGIILKTLCEIRQQMETLKREIISSQANNNFLEETNSKVAVSKCKINFSDAGIKGEVVLNASIHYPPYFLLAVENLWHGDASVRLSYHTHSSVRHYPKDLTIFQKEGTTLQGFTPSELKMRVVWKDVDFNELVVSPLKYIPIHGGVNILRFLHRCFSPSGPPEVETLLDSKLDICHHLEVANNPKSAYGCLQELAQVLGKAKWMDGTTLSIVDIAAWSVIKNLKNIDVPKTLSSWFNDCNLLIGLTEPK